MEQIFKYYDKILDSLVAKVIAGAFGAVFNNDLAVLFVLFVVIEVLDIVTRCIAESAKLYKERKHKDGNVYEYIMYFRAAHKARRINSGQMRSGFCAKMITYCIVLILSATADGILVTAHLPKLLTSATVSVLAVTEALSVLENLTDAGIGTVSKIKEKIIENANDKLKVK